MYRKWVLLAVSLSFPTQFTAQSASTSRDFTFQVLASQPWTDTGLDLQPGDVVEISASAFVDEAAESGTPACNPAGVSTAGQSVLPLPNAKPGTLIVKLHAHGATPVLVGARRELHVDEASHLFLGMNSSDMSLCQGGFTVQVQKISGNAPATSTQPSTRAEQLKSQLGNAAQIFLSGQFGSGTSNATSAGSEGASVVPAPTVSNTPLDAGLRAEIDGLPRRVNDQFNNLGDMVNFVIVGSQKDLQAALDAASWHVADTDNTRAALNAVMDTYANKDYLTMPMSTLYLFGRKQDFGYEMAEPIAMVASRHHFRIWKAPFTWRGSEVWVGAGTHDIGFAKDRRNNNVTHKIDPAVDGERDNVASSLQKAEKTKTLTYYLPSNPVQDAKNATGDGYHSDGRLIVIFLQ